MVFPVTLGGSTVEEPRQSHCRSKANPLRRTVVAWHGQKKLYFGRLGAHALTVLPLRARICFSSTARENVALRFTERSAVALACSPPPLLLKSQPEVLLASSYISIPLFGGFVGVVISGNGVVALLSVLLAFCKHVWCSWGLHKRQPIKQRRRTSARYHCANAAGYDSF